MHKPDTRKNTALLRRIRSYLRRLAKKKKVFLPIAVLVLAVASIGVFLLATRQPSSPRSAPSSGAPSGQQAVSSSPELVYQAEPGASAQNPAFSPDGKTMLFTVFHGGYNNGAASLRLLSLQDLHTVTTLVDDPDAAAVNLPGTSWNGPTGRIAFASDRKDREEIWTVAPNGQNLFRVTSHSSDSHFVEPSFSPDGKQLVFEEDTGKNADSIVGSLWRVNADGTNLTRLVDGPGAATDNRQPNWSPKGDRILFQRRNQGAANWTLYTIKSDGTDLRAITRGTSEDTDASWSPDGHLVVYSSNYGGLASANLFVMPADGGEPKRVTTDGARYDGAVSWSLDGKWLYYESRSGDSDNAPTAIWRIGAP